MDLEKRVKKAQQGDKQALEDIVAAIQDNVYNLSLRMLCNFDDAKDATQEILIIMITKLSTFQFKSQFRTWIYRVSANYLLNTKKARSQIANIRFDDFKHDLESDLEFASDLEKSPEYLLLLNELRISCTMGMLLCLDRKHRLAYILGDILELDQHEASECLSVSKDNFRQQLSRARAKVTEFTSQSCGLVSNNAKCCCEKKLKGALRRGRIDKHKMTFANNSKDSYLDVKQKITEMADDLRTVGLQSAIPVLKNPGNFIQTIEVLMKDVS